MSEARGREKRAGATFGTSNNYGDGHMYPSPTVPWDESDDALQHYIQHYSYDVEGNILELQHIGDDVGSTTTGAI